jgi:L-amino acid N-acyltransferase YncA
VTGGAELRPVTTPDVGAIRDIYAHHVLHGTGTFELMPPDEPEMAARIDAVTSAGLPFLVATDGRGVLGFAYAGPYRPRPAYRFTVEDSIYLHPDATGSGLGAPLLQAVLERCEALGVRQVIAVIGDSANLASIRTHEKCGFVHVGTFGAVGWKFDRWLDTVLMQRGLGT